MDLILAVRAGASDTGSYDLCKSVNIKCLKSDPGFDLILHLGSPCLCSEDTGTELDKGLIDVVLLNSIDDVQHVCRCAHDDLRLPLSKDLDLSCSVAARYGDSDGTELLACIVGAETSCKQAVSVSDVNEVTLLHARHSEAAAECIGPELYVICRISYDLHLACCTG